MSRGLSPLVSSSSRAIHDVDIRLDNVRSVVGGGRRVSRGGEGPGGGGKGGDGKGSPGGKKKKRGGKKDGFSSTFGKVKAIDPLALENKKHLENMANGFRELLDLHNTMELSSLCGMLGVRIERNTKNVEKKELIMEYVRKR